MQHVITLTFVLICYTALAQDTIIKTNGDIIRAKITEIGTEEVKFKIYGTEEGPTIVLKKSEIKKAKVAGQTIIDVKEDPGQDVIVKKNGETLQVKVMEISTDEVKFKLSNNPEGPTVSLKKSEIKQMKVQGQTIIDSKTGNSEDIITKKDGSTLKTEIIELGEKEVKFKLYNNPDGPLISLKKSDIKTIKVDGQVVYEHKEDPYSAGNSLILDKNSSLKFHFFSPLNAHLGFSYEWMLRPGFNWEVGLGIIGPGVSAINNLIDAKPKGFFFRTGPKFLLGSSSDIEIEGARYAHPLKGRYMKIEAIFNTFSITYTDYPGGSNTPVTIHSSYVCSAFNLIYGRQFILGNTITLGWYAGLGYGFESKTTDYTGTFSDFDPRRYSHSFFGKTLPITTTFGLNIGYIFKTPFWIENRFRKHVGSKAPSRNSMKE